MRRRPARPIIALLTVAALAGCASSPPAAHTVPTVPAPLGPPASFTSSTVVDP